VSTYDVAVTCTWMRRLAATAARLGVAVALLLSFGCRCASCSSLAAFRFAENPILTPQSSHTLGDNIDGPSLIRVPVWVRQPLGRYYLYFANHGGAHIRLAYAERLHGPWQVYEPGTLQLADTPACYDHVASPDVHIDRQRHQIVMYYHCPDVDDPRQQKTFIASSPDGIQFHSTGQPLGPSYFRVFPWKGHYYAIVRSGAVLRSPSLDGPYEPGPLLFGASPAAPLRHAAVDLRGDELWLYYSRIGDSPERILVSRVHLTRDWMSWSATPPQTVLSPDMSYEGSAYPVEISTSGEAEQVRQLRDPAIFRESHRTYILYSIAGESGLAIAELRCR